MLQKNVGANTQGSTNAAIAAKGALASTASGNLDTAITDSKNKKNAAVAATGTEHTKTDDAAKAYNNLAAIVEVEDPNNPDKWIEEGFEITETTIVPLPLPGQVINGSVSNSDFSGKADVHHDPLVNTDNYTHRVTKGDPLDDAGYIQITSPKVQYSKSNETVDLPSGYLNTPLFWKTTGHNSTGAGPESAPYGGGRING
jgi:hypothetical protein